MKTVSARDISAPGGGSSLTQRAPSEGERAAAPPGCYPPGEEVPIAPHLLLLTAALSGLGAAPYYDNTTVELEPLTEEGPPFYLEQLERATRRGPLEGVSIRDAAGTRAVSALSELPAEALYALYFAVMLGPEGAEWDLVVPRREAPPTPVSVWWEPDHQALVQVGPPWVRGGSAPPSAAAVEERHGVDVRDGDRGWSQIELASLDQALALLSDDERALFRALPFTRRQARSGRGGRVAAYEVDGAAPQVEVFGDTFAADGGDFVGTPEAPKEVSVFVLLHELGHGIVAVPALRAAAEAEGLDREAEALYADYERLAREVQGQVSRYNRAASPTLAEHEAIAAQVAAVKAAEEHLSAVVVARDAAARRALSLASQSPVLTAFIALGEEGPTPYGRTDPEESFAEAFALYKTDPDALKRAMPRTAAWMTGGGPLRAAVGSTLAPP
ncbi:MAG: hypothetical protein JXX28_02385 [Deltaproteobacteria bacterium]|nr:hypothetical protein [Deltaproteobacteria bacterium]